MKKIIIAISILSLLISPIFASIKSDFKKAEIKFAYLDKTSPDIKLFEPFRKSSSSLIAKISKNLKIDKRLDEYAIKKDISKLNKYLNDWDVALKRLIQKANSIKLSIKRDIDTDRRYSRDFPFLNRNKEFLYKRKRFLDSIHDMQNILNNKEYNKLDFTLKSFFASKNLLFPIYIKTEKTFRGLNKRLSIANKKIRTFSVNDKKIAAHIFMKASMELKQGRFKDATNDIIKIEKLSANIGGKDKGLHKNNVSSHSRILRARLTRLLSFMIRATEKPVKNYYQNALSILKSSKDDSTLKKSLPKIKDLMKKALKELLSKEDSVNVKDLKNTINNYKNELELVSKELSPKQKAAYRLYKSKLSEISRLAEKGDAKALKKLVFLNKLRENLFKDDKKSIDKQSLISLFSKVKRLYNSTPLTDKEDEFINNLLEKISLLIRKGRLSEASFILKKIEKKLSK